MIDKVDGLKARKITTMMFGYLFENKKKIEDRKKKQKRQTKKKKTEIPWHLSFFFPSNTALASCSSEKKKIVDVRLIVSLSE